MPENFCDNTHFLFKSSPFPACWVCRAALHVALRKIAKFGVCKIEIEGCEWRSKKAGTWNDATGTVPDFKCLFKSRNYYFEHGNVTGSTKKYVNVSCYPGQKGGFFAPCGPPWICYWHSFPQQSSVIASILQENQPLFRTERYPERDNGFEEKASHTIGKSLISQLLQSSVCGAQEEQRVASHHQFERSELIHTHSPLQVGEYTQSEGCFAPAGLCGQDRPQGCISHTVPMHHTLSHFLQIPPLFRMKYMSSHPFHLDLLQLLSSSQSYSNL